jgi:sec-independent protein translocase protein TatC
LAYEEQGEKLTLFEHLDELRSRLVICVITLAITTLFSLIFVPQLFEIMRQPAPEGFKPIYTEMTEMITTYFKVGLLAGAAMAMPMIVYQVIRFVVPALTSQEKKYLYALLPGVVISFLIGITFGYFLVLPFTVKYLLTFSGIADPFIKVGSYFSFVSSMLFWIGLSFESPIIIFFLAKINLVTAKKLASYRKYAVVGAFAASAIITPTPDPINQAIVAVPLILLYEIGILLARLA